MSCAPEWCNRKVFVPWSGNGEGSARWWRWIDLIGKKKGENTSTWKRIINIRFVGLYFNGYIFFLSFFPPQRGTFQTQEDATDGDGSAETAGKRSRLWRWSFISISHPYSGIFSVKTRNGHDNQNRLQGQHWLPVVLIPYAGWAGPSVDDDGLSSAVVTFYLLVTLKRNTQVIFFNPNLYPRYPFRVCERRISSRFP